MAAKYRQGGALVLTLVCLAGMLILFVILARLVMVERRVSRGYSELARAEMAAKAGSADAGNLLLYLFQKFPDSATFWDPHIGADMAAPDDSGKNPPGTVFLFRERRKIAGKNMLDMENSSRPTMYARPLLSGAETKPYDEYSGTLSKELFQDREKFIDVNDPEALEGGNGKGWIGAAPAKTPASVNVPWVEILLDPSKPKDMTIDSETGRPRNPAVARYAWWVEDESFKLNVNTAKAALRRQPDTETKIEKEKELGDPRPSLVGVFVSNEDVPAAQSVANKVADARGKLAVTGKRLLSPGQVGHAGAVPSDTTPKDFGQDYKFLLSTTNSGLDLSRAGAKRLSLNKVVDDSLEGISNTSYGKSRSGPDLARGGAAGKVKDAVNRIAVAIRTGAPRFGQRFYRTTSATNLLAATTSGSQADDKNKTNVVSTADADLYLRKLAANIYDFISPAVNPTVIDNGGEVVLGKPIYSSSDLGFDMDESASEEDNPVSAFGKKDIPWLTEYVWAVRTLKSQFYNPPNAEGASSTYEFNIDHYFEFWNLSGRDITPEDGDLGPNPYIVLENQPYITTNNRSQKTTDDCGNGRPFKIKLDEEFLVGGSRKKLVFRANEPTVITTDPDYASEIGKNKLAGKTVYVAAALYDPETDERVDVGVSKRPFSSPNWLPVRVPNVRHYLMDSFDRRSGGDYGEVQIGPDMAGAAATKFLMGNRFGLLDAQPSLGLRKYQNKNVLNVPNSGSTSPFSSSQLAFAAARGTWDPRTKIDMLKVKIQQANSTGDYATLRVGDVSLGVIDGLTSNNLWPSDLFPIASSKPPMELDNPLASVAGRPLRSIAELGGVFDPALDPSLAAGERRFRRPGGRTLTIGQPDAYWDGTRNSLQSASELSYQTSNSREWTAWRLADLFTVRRDEDRTGKANIEVEGLYNPNGILRDNGRALRALIEGIEFSEKKESDPDLAGKTFLTRNTAAGTESVTAALTQTVDAGGTSIARYLAQRLSRQFPTRFSPIWEPGELSQLQMFSPFSQTGSSAKQIDSGVDVAKLNDRGREEIVRRLVDLVTPKGNTYSVYVVGQALDARGKPTAIKAHRFLMRLRPEWNVAPKDDFDPESNGAVEARFSMPDLWKLEILGEENA